MADRETAPLDLRHIQEAAWANKLAKGFNTTDVLLELLYLQREVTELFTAWRDQLPDLAEEAADVVLFTAGLAEMLGIDLHAAVTAKLAKNAARTYGIGPNGFPIRLTDPAPPADLLKEQRSV